MMPSPKNWHRISGTGNENSVFFRMKERGGCGSNVRLQRRLEYDRRPVVQAASGCDRRIKEGVEMAFAFHHKHLHLDSHHPFWLWMAAVAAFILAVFWARPIG